LLFVVRSQLSVFMNPVITLLIRYQNRIETVLALLVIVSAVFRIFHLPFRDQLFMISMSSLAVYYFISSYLPSLIENKFATMAWKLTGISSSICIIGMLFFYLRLPGAPNILLIGMSALVIGGAGFLFFALREWSEKFYPLFGRIVFLTVISGGVIMRVVSSI
jgi:hypothetical protein